MLEGSREYSASSLANSNTFSNVLLVSQTSASSPSVFQRYRPPPTVANGITKWVDALGFPTTDPKASSIRFLILVNDTGIFQKFLPGLGDRQTKTVVNVSSVNE